MQKKWNRILKRALACVLVVVMTLTAAPLSGFVELELPKWNVGGWLNCVDGWFDSVGEWFSSKASALDATGLCGENVTYTYNSSTGELVISGTGAMYNYSSYITAQHSPFHGSGIKSVVIGEGVTSIGNCAFCNCTNLTNITIPSSVSQIYTPAFVGCTGMTEIIVSSANPIYHSSNNCVIRTDDKQLILGCKNCIIPSDGSVTSIGMSAFSNCANIESITIPNTVTRIGESAFERCTKLTNVTIPDSVTEIEKWAFYKCSNLKNVYIGNGVTSIADFAFSDCTRLTSVTIPDNVNNIGWSAFSECTGLKSITIGNGVRYIDLHAFYNCNNLLKINWNAEHVSYCGEDVFGKAGTAGSGIDVVIGDNVKNLPDHMFHVKYNSPKIKSVTIPDSVTSIGDYAFCGCTSLTSITIPDSVTSIGGSAFYGCTSLASITIPDSVASIGDTAFRNCDGLTSITIPDSVTSIEYWTFLDCTSLTSVTIPDSVTSIDSSAFLGCDNLHSVFYMSNIESWLAIEFSDTSSNPLNNGASLYIDNILAENIVIPNSVQLIPNYAFCGCTSLTSITTHDSVTSIGVSAFEGCSNLTSVTIPNSVTSIGEYSFANCTSLTSIAVDENNSCYSSDEFGVLFNEDKTILIQYPIGNSRASYIIPDSVTSIGGRAFYKCTSLSSITIPDSVTSIGSSAFSGCKNLTIICCKNSEAEAYAKKNSIKYTYGGYLSNGLYWQLNFDMILEISGSASSIPGFTPGQAPWSSLAEDIRSIQIDVNNLKSVGQYAFFGLSEAVGVDFHTEKLTSIGKYAFFGMISGMQMFFDGTSRQWNNLSIDYGNDAVKQARVYCRGNDCSVEPVHVPKKSENPTFENFVEEHVEIAKNFPAESLDYAGFYNNVVINQKTLNAIKTWDVIGDIGKAVSFKFYDLSFFANYYDIYLSELILALNNEQKSGALEWKVGKNYNETYKDIMKLFKTSEEWEEYITPKTLKELEEIFKGKSFELTDGTKVFLEKIFKNLYKNHKKAFTSVFEGLDSASSVLDVINDAADIANMFIDAYNAYIVSKAFYEVNDEFFDVLYASAHSLFYTSWGLYGKEFMKSIDKAKSNKLGNLEAIFNSMFDFTKDAVEFAYDKVIKEALEQAVYPTVAAVLGCTNIGAVNSASLAYNIGYRIVDSFLRLSDKSEAYKTMNAIAPIEGRLRSVLTTYRSNLINNPTEKNAKKYDMAYNILRQTNIYLYDTAYKFDSYIGKKDELSTITQYKNNWNNWKCHYGIYGSSYNLFSVHCPVDVYIFDANGLLVTAVVNEEITQYSDDITISVFNGEKSFAYPTNKDYTVKIVAREEGAMDYSAGVVTDTETQFEVKSYNIPLSENQEFTVEMPTSVEEATDEDYMLQTNETSVDFDYDSANTCDEHSFGEWISKENAEERICEACGFVEYKSECDHSKCEEILVYSIVPTCKNTGYGYYTCSGCGERISDVGEIPAVECDYSKEEFEATCTENPYARYTCIYCLDSYLEGITLEELNNSAHEYTETITEATCVSGGYTDYYCNVCEHTYTGNETAINKDAHKDAFTSKTEPTCTEDGYSIYTCTLCGNESKKDEVPAKGHSYKSVVTKSTCTEEGYTTYACSVCGDTYQDDFVAALGHTSVTDPAVDATCTKTGLTEGSHCSVCGEVLTAQKETSALGHTYGEYVVTTEPTCTKAGVETKTCSVCGDKQTRPVAALGHTEVIDPAVAATCTETGLTEGSHCSVCGEVLTAQKEISALGHTYGEYVVTIQPTCTKAGVETKTCSVCGDKQTRPVAALGHTDTDADGNCDNCGEIMEAVKTCSHMCHKGGFSGFIWKLINLFNKLFRTNKTCSCGVNHY